MSDTYGYDDGGRLGTVAETIGSTTTNETRTYDGYDNLTTLADTTGTTTVNSTLDWDPTHGVAALLADTRNGATTDITGLNNWDTTTTGGTTSAVGVDVYGSVTNTPGQPNLTCASSYTVYGTTTATPTAPCLGYRGDLTAGGLDYLHARNYNPDTGNFTTVDPQTGTPGTDSVATPYPYANNNPITNTDPTGMYAVNDLAYSDIGPILVYPQDGNLSRQLKIYQDVAPVYVRGFIRQSCLASNAATCLTRGGKKANETVGQILAIWRLSSSDESFWQRKVDHASVSNRVDWEVCGKGRCRATGGARSQYSRGRADIVESESGIYEVKYVYGSVATARAAALDQAKAYKSKGYRGIAPLADMELGDKLRGWVSGFVDSEGTTTAVWSPESGVILVAPLDKAPEDVRVKARRDAESESKLLPPNGSLSVGGNTGHPRIPPIPGKGNGPSPEPEPVPEPVPEIPVPVPF